MIKAKGIDLRIYNTLITDYHDVKTLKEDAVMSNDMIAAESAAATAADFAPKAANAASSLATAIAKMIYSDDSELKNDLKDTEVANVSEYWSVAATAWSIAAAAANSAESMILASAAAHRAVDNLVDVTNTFTSDAVTAKFLQDLLHKRTIVANSVNQEASIAAIDAGNAYFKTEVFASKIEELNLNEKYQHILDAIKVAEELFPIINYAITLSRFKMPSLVMEPSLSSEGERPALPPPPVAGSEASLTVLHPQWPATTTATKTFPRRNRNRRKPGNGAHHGGTKKSRKRKTNRRKTNRRKTNRRKTNRRKTNRRKTNRRR